MLVLELVLLFISLFKELCVIIYVTATGGFNALMCTHYSGQREQNGAVH